ASAASAEGTAVTWQPIPSRHIDRVARMFFSSSMTSTRSVMLLFCTQLYLAGPHPDPLPLTQEREKKVQENGPTRAAAGKTRGRRRPAAVALPSAQSARLRA